MKKSEIEKSWQNELNRIGVADHDSVNLVMNIDDDALQKILDKHLDGAGSFLDEVFPWLIEYQTIIEFTEHLPSVGTERKTMEQIFTLSNRLWLLLERFPPKADMTSFSILSEQNQDWLELKKQLKQSLLTLQYVSIHAEDRLQGNKNLKKSEAPRDLLIRRLARLIDENYRGSDIKASLDTYKKFIADVLRLINIPCPGHLGKILRTKRK